MTETVDTAGRGIALAGARLAEALLTRMITRGEISQDEIKALTEREILNVADALPHQGAENQEVRAEAVAWLEEVQYRAILAAAAARPASPAPPAPPPG